MTDERPQLTPRAEPMERTDVRTPDASGTSVTLAEAEARFEVSKATLRRKLDANAIPGAHKVPGRKGEEWRLPIASLRALGYHDREEAQPAPAAAAGVDELAATIRTLRDLLEGERRALMAAEEHRHDAEREREQARIEAARAETQLEAERALRERIEAELEQERARKARRRWFGR